MNCPWYWYLEELEYAPGFTVRLHAEQHNAIRAHYWIVPVRNQSEDWNLYLRPAEQTVNGEWVVVKRERPRKYKTVARGVDVCECCGNEETVWEQVEIEE